MKERILNLLRESENQYVSGQNISEKLGVSRAAIWKHITALKEEGYEIDSISRKGYMLIGSPDILTYGEVSKNLHTSFIGRKILYFDSIDSTNKKAKELAFQGEQEGTLVVSEEQTMGRGRLGRSWSSPKKKGIWMSLILRPQVEPEHISKITLLGAAAIATALEEMNADVKIKWPNDITLQDKKLCGILTEMSGELNEINYVVMGMGINVNADEEDFPMELKTKATSLKACYGKDFDRKELLARIMNNFEELYQEFIQERSIETTIKICKEKSVLLGKDVRIIRRGNERAVTAVDINQQGELIVKNEQGELERIISGEVSVRGLYGYI